MTDTAAPAPQPDEEPPTVLYAPLGYGTATAYVPTAAYDTIAANLAASRAEASALRVALERLIESSEELGALISDDPHALSKPGQPGLGIVSRLVLATLDGRAALAVLGQEVVE